MLNSPILYHGSHKSALTNEQIDMQVFDQNIYTNFTSPLIKYDLIDSSNILNQVIIDR